MREATAPFGALPFQSLRQGRGEPEGPTPSPEPAPPPGGGLLGDPARFGLWAFMGTVSMLFVGFTSAYIVRRTLADWVEIAAPPLLWINTAVLLASSVLLERGRRLLHRLGAAAGRQGVAAAGLLGLGFLGGQALLWRALAAQGVYLATTPHSSFVYMLTAVHAAHLLGALLWFAAVAHRLATASPAAAARALDLFSTFWHFLGVVWVYLVVLLFVL